MFGGSIKKFGVLKGFQSHFKGFVASMHCEGFKEML